MRIWWSSMVGVGDDAKPLDDPADAAALSAYAEALADAVIDAAAGLGGAGRRRPVPGVARRRAPGAVVAAGREAGAAAVGDVEAPLRALLAQDVDEQRSNPLAVVRRAVAHPTTVLRARGRAARRARRPCRAAVPRRRLRPHARRLRRPGAVGARTRSRVGCGQGPCDPCGVAEPSGDGAYGGPGMAERLVVIGGDAGGMSAAMQARRRKPYLEIVALEKGDWTSYSACGIPYLVGGEVASLDDLVARSPEEFRDKHRIDVRLRHEAMGIDARARTVEVRDHGRQRNLTISYDQLHVATGARPDPPRRAGDRPRPREGRPDARRRQGAARPRPHLPLPVGRGGRRRLHRPGDG